ncbi:MAG: peptide deformylase [Patescibacteria group bacterium]|nr:peptide deformylase [Patescibacteria group bacterium]
MVKVVQKENPVLRKTAKEVTDISKVKNVIQNMVEALDSQEDGVAIAAPQIAESLRIFIVSRRVFENNENMIFINPEIIKKSKDKKLMDEGCLSVRPLYGKVRRASRATVKALNEKGEEFILKGTGLLAHIFQHEIDHLNGILFIDKAKDLREVEEV